MAFLDFDGVYTPETVIEGEYRLRVLEAEIKTQKPEKGSGTYLQLKLEIPDNSKAKDITHVMMLPTDQDDMKKKNNRLSAIQNFLIACGYENVDNVNELVGATPWAILTEEESEGFGKQNRVKKFVIGR